MFTFTLTAATVEDLNAQILAAAERIISDEPPERRLQDFPLQDIVEYLKTKGFEVS